MSTNRFLGAAFFIAGTSVGAGILALPVSTGLYGFFPSVILLLLCWACMTCTGLLFLEVSLWLPSGANIVSMAGHTLGLWGKLIAWATYLMLFYALLSAYVSGMGDLVKHMAHIHLHMHISTGVGALALIVLVGAAIYCGMHAVDYLNRFFFFGKFLTYALVLITIFAYVHWANLTVWHFQQAFLALPIVITAFGFQNTVPILRVYLNDDIRKLRLAIILGSTIALAIYLLWEWVILGTLPITGSASIKSALAFGQPATGLALALGAVVQKNGISTLFSVFAVFGIATSFIGIACSLFAFLMDSFSIPNHVPGKLLALSMTFLPPLLFAFLYPQGFIFALGYAGIFVAILLGALPAAMVWRGRYVQAIRANYKVRVTRFGLSLILLFATSVIVAHLYAA